MDFTQDMGLTDDPMKPPTELYRPSAWLQP